MALEKQVAHLFKGFSKLTFEQRVKRLTKMGALTSSDADFLKNKQPLNLNLAEHFIENALGYFHLPFGVATNFRIDGRDYAIPMAVEETSIIAAASKTAKWVRESGEIRTEMTGSLLIGQIQFPRIKDVERAKRIINENKNFLIEHANQQVATSMVERGGGVKEIELRTLQRPDGDHMIILHILVDTCDAMGANLITMVCECLKEPLENLLKERVAICILSNLNTHRLAKAHLVIYNINPKLGEKIAEASLFAELDPYRASTHNKGILNGMDAVILATGNDWRAMEAGAHAYACQQGQYQSLSRWTMEGDHLHGHLTAPISVGTVGGVTRLHPTAKLALNMLGIKSANELSRIIAAVGLIQNLGAIKALGTDGLIKGHMKLHIDNLSLGAGAVTTEMPIMRNRLEEIFNLKRYISLSTAKKVLREIRSTKSTVKAAVKAVVKEVTSIE